MMSHYEKHGLDEDNFGAKGGIVSAFDAFRMSLLSSFFLFHSRF